MKNRIFYPNGTSGWSLSPGCGKSMAILAFAILASPVLISQAQIVDLDRSRLSQAAYYNYSEPGDVTIKVHVWGAVRFPGLYEVPRGTVFSELLSLSGGPQFPERGRRATRVLGLQLDRRSTGGLDMETAYKTEMTNRVRMSNDDIPLMNGDILTLESTYSRGFQWRDLFPVISTVGTLILIIDGINS